MKNELDKNCVLMFDEVSLDTGLQYNSNLDQIDGFVDLGSNRRPIFANHAVLFMIKGIYTKWKQPIAFYFVENCTNTNDLVVIIKDVVRRIRETGLNIVASICDQGATNSAAINYLLKATNDHCVRSNVDNNYQGYLIDDEEIIHLYDGPHLLKGIRNNLLNKNLHFTQDGVKKVASWQHITDFYYLDQKMGNYNQCIKLTDEHIVPNKIKKMKVSKCAQVFSHTVAAALKSRALTSRDLNNSSEYYITPAASDTADVLEFFDKLFDSINGSSMFGTPKKEKNQT